MQLSSVSASSRPTTRRSEVLPPRAVAVVGDGFIASRLRISIE
jgi:hypothetical protein